MPKYATSQYLQTSGSRDQYCGKRKKKVADFKYETVPILESNLRQIKGGQGAILVKNINVAHINT